MLSFRHGAAILVGCAALFSAAGAARAQDAGGGSYLKDGDVVVFYGDSITDQRLYTTFVENYIVTRFPHLNVRFIHSGWGGDRVGGGGGGPIDRRLQRDVFAYKPTVMTIMLAMNDGGYRPFDQGIFDTFSNGYTHIFDSVQKTLPGIRMTAIQPSPYDDVTHAPNFPEGYNSVLIRYGQFAKELAQRNNQNIADLNTPVVAMLQKAKEIDPGLASKILPDRVHPGPGGHLIMAEALLKSWNSPAIVTNVEIDAAGKRVVHSDNTQVTELKAAGAVSWTQIDGALPMPIDFRDSTVALAVKSSNVLDAIDMEPLKVTGLPAGSYDVKIDGSEAGTFTQDQLAQGINLATLRTPMSQQATKVAKLTQQHNDLHFFRWRQIQVPCMDHSRAVQDALPTLLAALDGEEAGIVAQQHSAAQPMPHHYEVAVALPAPPPPAGANIALNKKYECSDPNTYNWGIGGLTDGSWEGTNQHCFASGDANTFPKTATIDLEKVTPISDVMLGVPGFGSTKTITVSVSEDGKTFTDVGSYVFSQRNEERHRYNFKQIPARYLRLTYPDHYDEQADYPPTFVFTTEVEVYNGIEAK